MEPKNKYFTIVIVGGDAVRTVRTTFADAGINWVNEVNLIKKGRLGNFKTFTYAVSVPDGDDTKRRKQIVNALIQESTHLLTLYPSGEYFRIYVMDKRAFCD